MFQSSQNHHQGVYT